MPKGKCCVVSQSRRRLDPLIIKSAKEFPIINCQFENTASSIIIYENEQYCMLHLPNKSPEKDKLKKNINELIAKLMSGGHENFNYISCSGNSIMLGTQKEYTFYGASLTNTTLHGRINNNLLLHYCYVHDSKFSDLEGKRLEFRNCIFSLKTKVAISYLTHLFVSECKMTHSEREVLLDDNYHFCLEGGRIGWVRFIHNIFETTLRIAGTEIKELDLSANIFYSCPELYSDITKNIRNIDLPDIKAFKFDYFPRRSLNDKIKYYYNEVRHGKSPRVFDTSWRQYKRFRELYKIAKEQQLYAEQSTFFTLMQKCLYLSKSQPFSLKIVSYLYRDISDYGQSIIRPLVLLLATTFLFSGTYYLGNLSMPQAFNLSVTQTFVPFSIFKDNKLQYEIIESGSKLDNNDNPSFFKQETSLFSNLRGIIFVTLSVFQSSISIALIACFLLGLRWNFRKA